VPFPGVTDRARDALTAATRIAAQSGRPFPPHALLIALLETPQTLLGDILDLLDISVLRTHDELAVFGGAPALRPASATDSASSDDLVGRFVSVGEHQITTAHLFTGVVPHCTTEIRRVLETSRVSCEDITRLIPTPLGPDPERALQSTGRLWRPEAADFPQVQQRSPWLPMALYFLHSMTSREYQDWVLRVSGATDIRSVDVQQCVLEWTQRRIDYAEPGASRVKRLIDESGPSRSA
jgi:hypothetical protein